MRNGRGSLEASYTLTLSLSTWQDTRLTTLRLRWIGWRKPSARRHRTSLCLERHVRLSNAPSGRHRAGRGLVGGATATPWLGARSAAAGCGGSGRPSEPEPNLDRGLRSTHQQPDVGRRSGQHVAARQGDRIAEGLRSKRSSDRGARPQHPGEAHEATRGAAGGTRRERDRRRARPVRIEDGGQANAAHLHSSLAEGRPPFTGQRSAPPND